MILLLLTAPVWAADCERAFQALVPPDVPCALAVSASEARYADAATGDGVGVRVSMDVSRAGAPYRTAPIGTPVCNGDALALSFTPSEPGFIAVLNHGTSGRWTLLFPVNPGEKGVVAAGIPTRLPPASGFPVSGAPGTEHVLLFLSSGPFSAELQALLDRVRGHEGAPAAAHPAVVGSATRGVAITYLAAGSSPVVVGQTEQVIAFAITHAASCPPLP